MGMLYARSKLHLVDEATGRQGVRESRLATGQQTGHVLSQKQGIAPLFRPVSL